MRRGLLTQLRASLEFTAYATFLHIFCIDRALLQLALRCITQVQIGAPSLSPGRPLSFFAAFLLFSNACLILGHAILPLPTAAQRKSSILIDFVGSDYVPSKLYILALDLAVTALQLVYLLVVWSQSPSNGDDSDEDEWEDADSKSDDSPPHFDPYSRPLLVLRLRQTIRRIMSSAEYSPAEDASLTARGRRNRRRRHREGATSSRVDDAADEEERIGFTTAA